MSRRDLDRALREAPIPDEIAARERARRTVLAAHAQAAPRHRTRVAVAWVALVAAIAALAATQLSPAQAIEGIWRTVVPRPTVAPTPAPSGLELPARGRLLVTDGGALYVVERSGERRRLGAWQDATWSPNGLFAGVSARHSVAAIEPRTGAVRWRVTRPERVALPRWAPDGLHVAYRSGHTLRIVYGNGRHDVLAGRGMAAVAPAWRPNDGKTVAWAASDGRVTVEDADTAKVLWSFGSRRVTRLAWSADGQRLLIGGPRSYTIRDVVAGARDVTRLPRGTSIAGAAFAPRGARLAVATFDGSKSVVRIEDAVVLRAPGRLRDLVWSPDGRWLLAGWPGADHWLAVGQNAVVSAVRQPFGRDARVRGWCC